MKKTIDTNKLSAAQIKAMVRYGILDKSEIATEVLDITSSEAMQFLHVHLRNSELASLASMRPATWAWNITNGHTIKLYKLLIERLNITPSELLILQSASHLITRIVARKAE